MPSQIPEKIRFSDQIEGLKSRMVSIDNAAQKAKLEMLQSIKSDYVKSLEKAKERRDE